MILVLAAAMARPPLVELGRIDGDPLTSRASDDAIELEYRNTTHRIDAPAADCTASVRAANPIQVTWICAARIDRFGDITELELDPTTWAESPRQTPSDGAEWLTRAIEEAARTEPHRATILVAQYAGRLQYAVDAEHRERVLIAMIDRMLTTAESHDTAEKSAAEVMRLLHSPPVWETERPWDYATRLRVGPPVGNRPAPERAGWLSGTTENQARVRRMAKLLRLGGQPRAAADLTERLQVLDPPARPQ